MKRTWRRALSITLVLPIFFVLGALAPLPWGHDTPTVTAQTTPTPTPRTTPTPVFDQAAAVARVRELIKGKENEPAEAVFKNIQSLKGIPAKNLLAIMEFGFSRSLGVSCTHCHTPGTWEADGKTQKPVAREMWAMTGTINNQLLKGIENLGSASPTVNCTTCHRGQIKPALNLQ